MEEGEEGEEEEAVVGGVAVARSEEEGGLAEGKRGSGGKYSTKKFENVLGDMCHARSHTQRSRLSYVYGRHSSICIA